jgi:hypothetical protein
LPQGFDQGIGADCGNAGFPFSSCGGIFHLYVS